MCGLPSWLDVVVERAEGPCYRVTLEMMALEYAASAHGPNNYNPAERIRPRAEAWREFLTALEAAKVWQWAPAYTGSEDTGLRWSVEMAQHFRNLTVSGTNTLPPGFDQFCAAMRGLLGREFA